MTASQPDGVLAVHSIQPWKKRKRTEEITVQFIADDSTKTPKGERKREKKKVFCFPLWTTLTGNYTQETHQEFRHVRTHRTKTAAASRSDAA